MHPNFKKVVLLILDGFGIASKSRGNAIYNSDPQNLNRIISLYPSTTLQASGPLVGLPWGEMGNSEVGHLNIGAGRIVNQDLPRITAAIQDGNFFNNQTFLKAIEHVKKNNSKLHLLGMVSAGGVHSYDEHLYALLGLAADQGLSQAFIHMITDGRDTEEKVALVDLEKMRSRIEQIGLGKIATISGRFYAMDRGGHWQQTETEYQAMVNGAGETAVSALDCVATNYAKGIYDEMIKPTVILENGQPVAKVESNDAVIFFNFRQDRAIQLTMAFVQPDKMPIEPKHPALQNLMFVTMTSYMEGLPVEIAFPQMEIKDDLAEIVANAGMRQFHAAESEKFAHVTSFFNGGKMDALAGEERMIISSPDNANNYSDHPEMSVAKLTDTVLDRLKNSDTNFFVVNFANADMVGHTGNLQSTINAIKAIDQQLQRLEEGALEAGACLIITGDHGNAEQMVNVRSGEIDKDHTTSPVPLILIAKEFQYAVPIKKDYASLASIMPEGSLSDIAPTILDLFGLPVPAVMTGISLLPTLLLEAQGSTPGLKITSPPM